MIENSKIRKVVLNMLKVRNYKIPETETGIEEFMQTEEQLTNRIDDQEKKLFIFFPKIPKVGVINIRQFIKEMDENEVDHSIIIVKDTITAFAKQIFVEAKPKIIEYFKEEEFKINKLEHKLVPKHTLISDSEKKDLLKMYRSKETQLQKIFSTDPIARIYGARRGQVFKIERISETAGTYINYRLVV